MNRATYAVGIYLLLALAIGAIACQAPEPASPPLLPPGFEEAPLPDADFDAYVYLSQGASTVVAGDLLSLSGNLQASQLQAWAGQEPLALGMRLTLGDSSQAAQVAQFINQQAEQALWAQSSDSLLYVAQKKGSGGNASKDAIENQKWTTLAARYLEPWKTMKYLPDKPPGEPVGAGFVRFTPGLLAALSASGPNQEPLTRMLDGLRTAGANHAIFAAYLDKTLTISRDMSLDSLRAAHASVILVTRTSGLGSLASGVFTTIAGSMGMQETTFDSIKANYFSQNDMHVLMATKANLIYITVAPSLEESQKLLSSAYQRP